MSLDIVLIRLHDFDPDPDDSDVVWINPHAINAMKRKEHYTLLVLDSGPVFVTETEKEIMQIISDVNERLKNGG